MRVSKSKFEDYGCPRRGFYKHVKKIERLDASDLALIYGSAIHKGFDTLFSLQKNLDRDPVSEAQAAFRAEFETYTGPDDPKGQRTMKSGEETLAAFQDQWLSRYPWEDIAGERKYVMPLLNPDGSEDEFVAIIDRVGILGDVPTILEFKTTGWPHLFTIEPNIQVEGQALLLQHELNKFQYRDVLFILIHISDNAKGGYIVPKRAKPGADLQSIFRPLPVTLTEEKLKETEQDIRARIQFMKQCEITGYYPKVTERCGDFGGCPYKRLCVLDPAERGLIEATLYKKCHPVEKKEWGEVKE